MSKKVIYKKKDTAKYLPEKVKAELFLPLGSYYARDTQAPARIPRNIEDILLPFYLNKDKGTREYLEAMDDFYRTIGLKVLYEGTTLEIGLEDDDKPISLSNMPINMLDYIKHHYFINHPWVAKTTQELGLEKKYAFIEDKDAEIKQKAGALKLKEAAYKEYYKISDDEGKVSILLAAFGIRASNLSFDEKQVTLSGFMEREPEKFVKFCNDKNLSIRAEIEEMLAYEVIRRVGSTFIYIDNPLGDDMDSTIAFLNHPKQSSLLLTLRSALKDKSKISDWKSKPSVTTAE